ncbi:hypothetical protein F2Q68_00045380 [Brassica cretica]|uniref:Uncharacterized protein n=1 Tax=Brassica cretica TaxID=69181 RepID=A0A8S9LJ42_BRACR|nr:hypothetical protein F2Q68_00045380 [Brassica cretica]
MTNRGPSRVSGARKQNKTTTLKEASEARYVKKNKEEQMDRWSVTVALILAII